MNVLKFAASALILCVVLGSAASAAVFPSMPKSPHTTQSVHGTSHSGKHHKHK